MNEELSPEVVEPVFDETAYYKGKKRRTILWAAVFYFIACAFLYCFAEGSEGARTLRFIIAISGQVFLIRWFYLDAEFRGFRLTKAWLVCLFLFGAITGAFYFFRTRGRGVWRSLGKMLLVGLFMVFCSGAGVMSMHTFASFFPNVVTYQPNFLEE